MQENFMVSKSADRHAVVCASAKLPCYGITVCLMALSDCLDIMSHHLHLPVW